MAAQIKYLIFKGIEKKEQILFKSFLNLAKNELTYQVVILKPDAQSVDAPDILIMDESYQLDEDEQSLSALPTVIVGHNVDDDASNYIARPVQWSDFKTALTSLDIDTTEEEEPVERVLPSDVKFAIADVGEPTVVSVEEDEVDFAEEADYDYELGQMSVDYQSITNSDYMKVVNDVQQFNDMSDSDNPEPVILMTDDESASANSVLVIETNSLDAWDFTEVESDAEHSVSDFEFESNRDIEPSPSETIVEAKVGRELKPDESYWLEDNEMIANNKSVLFIKADRGMVYSDVEPGKWLSFLQRSNLTRLPLSAQWRPTSNLKVYPIDRLLWVNTLVNEGSQLLHGLNEEQEYILKCWPKFELLELDNTLLKLCSMLFVQPESVVSLAQKSGYGRSTIRGLMNACYEADILKLPRDVNLAVLPKVNSNESVFGKIKDVFR